MSEILAKVEALNKKIEEIMRKKTVAETQRSMHQKSLAEKIAEYNEKYGVDLSAKSVAESSQLIRNEYNMVMETLKNEYEKSTKVVDLIDSGRVAEARKLLGVDDEKVEPAKEEKILEEKVGGVTSVNEHREEPKMSMNQVGTSVLEPVEKSVAQVHESPKKVEEVAPVQVQVESKAVESTPESFAKAAQMEARMSGFRREKSREELLREELGDEEDYYDDEDTEGTVTESEEDDDFGFSFGSVFHSSEDSVKPVETGMGMNIGTGNQQKQSGLTAAADVVKEFEGNKEVSKSESEKKKPSFGFSFDDDDDDDGFDFSGILQGSKFEV